MLIKPKPVMSYARIQEQRRRQKAKASQHQKKGGGTYNNDSYGHRSHRHSKSQDFPDDYDHGEWVPELSHYEDDE